MKVSIEWGLGMARIRNLRDRDETDGGHVAREITESVEIRLLFKGRDGSLSPLKFYDSLNIYQHFSVKTVIT